MTSLVIDGVVIGPLRITHRGEYEVRLPDYTTLAASNLCDLQRRVIEQLTADKEELSMRP